MATPHASASTARVSAHQADDPTIRDTARAVRRKSTGGVVEKATKRGTSYGIRYRAGGRRIFQLVGSSANGTTRQDAERELAFQLALIARGEWRPPVAEAEPVRQIPTFHVFASEWHERRKLEGLRPRTLEHLTWTLVDHLLPYFHRMRLDEIGVAQVDGYVQHKVREGRLGNASINRTVAVLASVLEVAVEYDHIATNPARGRRRRLPTTKPARPWLEPDQVRALLDAAGELDDADRAGRRIRRPLLATLAYAGLRIGETLALTWADVDLAAGRIHVRASKTEAGVRDVDIQPELRDELLAWKMVTRRTNPEHLVFGTSTGRPDSRNNVRRRVLVRAAEGANERITERGGCERLPDALSPHALRRSFASWLIGEGEDVAYVQQQLGHEDPSMTLGIYAKALRSKSRRPHARRALTGTSGDLDALSATAAETEEAAETAR
jgi:integrase